MTPLKRPHQVTTKNVFENPVDFLQTFTFYTTNFPSASGKKIHNLTYKGVKAAYYKASPDDNNVYRFGVFSRHVKAQNKKYATITKGVPGRWSNPCNVLGWGTNMVIETELDDRAYYFLTASLNGCCVIFYYNPGTKKTIAVHANVNADISDSAQSSLKKTARLARNKYYEVLTHHLKKKLGCEIIGAFYPSFYQDRYGLDTLMSIVGFRCNKRWRFFWCVMPGTQYIPLYLKWHDCKSTISAAMDNEFNTAYYGGEIDQIFI